MTLKQTMRLEMEMRLIRQEIAEREAVARAYVALLDDDRNGATTH